MPSDLNILISGLKELCFNEGSSKGLVLLVPEGVEFKVVAQKTEGFQSGLLDQIWHH